VWSALVRRTTQAPEAGSEPFQQVILLTEVRARKILVSALPGSLTAPYHSVERVVSRLLSSTRLRGGA
jgi:hypothetical protein